MIHNFFKLLVILLISCNSTALYASFYDDDVLDIYSKIIPRLILMSSEKSKFKDKLDICIVNDKADDRTAFSLSGKVASQYPEGIKNLKIKMMNTSYSNIEICQNAQMLFLLNSSESNIEKATKYSNEHAIITMSYDAKYLDNGVGLSLFLGRKVTPYINMGIFRKTGIELDNVLLRISKIYNEDDK